MRQRLGEAGKITMQAVIIIGLIAVVGYLIYDSYYSPEARRAREGGTAIVWSVILENGDIVQLETGESMTLYKGIIDPLALYSDSTRKNKIQAFRSDLYINPQSERTGDVTISSDGYGNYLQIIDSGGTVKWNTSWISKTSQSIPPNVETKLSEWYGVVGAGNFGSLATGTYTIKSIYGFKATQGDLVASISAEATVTAYWTKDTLTIVARVGWSPLKLA